MLRGLPVIFFLNTLFHVKEPDHSVKQRAEPENGKHKLLPLITKTNVEYYPLKHKIDPKSTILPPNEFKPKQSLGQNFLNDVNILSKLRYHLGIPRDTTTTDNDQELKADTSGHVVELGAGTGSLTKILFEKYPDMTAIEIDARAICMLSRVLPGLDMIHDDVLQTDFSAISKHFNKKLWVIGNLPFYITTQIFFCLIDYRHYIDRAILVTQKEVADRLVASPGEKHYSKISVITQLYTDPKILFDIPSHVFYPIPKVSASAVRLDFNEGPSDMKCSPFLLKRVIFEVFNMKRKFLKTSLALLLKQLYVSKLPAELENRRGYTLYPEEFVYLAEWLQANGLIDKMDEDISKSKLRKKNRVKPIIDVDSNFGKVWRKSNHGDDPQDIPLKGQ